MRAARYPDAPLRASPRMAARWGLLGLLGFELTLLTIRLVNGTFDQFSLMAALAAGALVWALIAHARAGAIPRFALMLLVAVTLARALAQTVPGPAPLGVLPTYFVPLGFALLLVARAPTAWGVGVVAAARSWFVVWYFLIGVPEIAIANVLAAIGMWIWFVGASGGERAAPAEDTTGAPPS